MESDKLFIYTRKELFVPAEFSFLIHWCPILESAKTKSGFVYLQLQTGIVDDAGNSRISVATIAHRLKMNSNSVHECLKVLEEYKFITRVKKEGQKNSYMILDLPMAPTESKEGRKESLKIEEEPPQHVEGEPAEVAIFSVGIDDHRQRIYNAASEALSKLYTKDNWNANDMGNFYRFYYTVSFEGIKPQDKITMKERSFLKRMIEEYGWQSVAGMISYAIDNWTNIDYLNGYPSISGIYGFRNTLMPESKIGANSKSKRGQHSSTGKKGVGVW